VPVGDGEAGAAVGRRLDLVDEGRAEVGTADVGDPVLVRREE
jgi:hypothetical protein